MGIQFAREVRQADLEKHRDMQLVVGYPKITPFIVQKSILQ